MKQNDYKYERRAAALSTICLVRKPSSSFIQICTLRLYKLQQYDQGCITLTLSDLDHTCVATLAVCILRCNLTEQLFDRIDLFRAAFLACLLSRYIRLVVKELLHFTTSMKT